MRFIPAVSPVRIQSPLPSTGETRERLAGHPLSKQRRPVGQVVKTRPFHGCNMGSSPVRVTTSAIRKRDCRINGGLAQLVRAPASHAGGRWFESISLHQDIETRTFPIMGTFGFSVLSILAKIAGLIDEKLSSLRSICRIPLTVGRVFVPFFSIYYSFIYAESPPHRSDAEGTLFLIRANRLRRQRPARCAAFCG